MMTKYLNFVFCVALTCVGVTTQAFAWQPAPGYTQIPIWPAGKMPDPLTDVKIESEKIIMPVNV